jgi:uncharacterized iron-regulated membrane protein
MTDVAASPSVTPGVIKRLFATLHLWVGVIIGIPAAILGVTGIFLMVTHPLPTKVSTETFAPIASVDAVIAAVRAAAPEGATLQQIEAAPVGAPINVRLSVPRTEDNPRGLLRMQVDPTTLAVKPAEAHAEMSIARIAHDLHGSFMIGREGGRPVVGWVGVFMCGLACSGIVLWWPRRGGWSAAFKITGNGTTWMVLREIHGASGIWGLIVFFIISFTGVLVAFPPAGAGGPGRDVGRRSKAPIELHADEAVAQSLNGRGDYVLRALSLPRAAGDTYQVSIMPVGSDRYMPPVTVTVDAAGAQVVEVKNTAEDARAWARPVHVGGGMGMVWWGLTLLSGILPVIFAISGIWMWLIKRGAKARMAERPLST